MALKKPIKEQKELRAFARKIRKVFTISGFHHNENTNKTFTFEGLKIEIDGIFTFQKIIVLVEDTASAEPKHHFKEKTLVFNHIQANSTKFIKYLRSVSQNDSNLSNTTFSDNTFKLIFLYASRWRLNPIHLSGFPQIKYWGYSTLSYFYYLTRAIGKTTRFELFRYFGIAAKELIVGASTGGDSKFDAFVIPEAPSGYPENCKLVTFYMDPDSLLRRGYVLRRDNWEAKDNLYQRMVKASKIRSMRKYLAEYRRVYTNNIIVSLPSTAQFFDGDKQVPKETISAPQKLSISLKDDFNSIGIIDGQHRVYSYHESIDDLDKKIAPLRASQHLLITGIVFPQDHSEVAQTRLQAQLFLEINDKQTRTSSSLRQSIKSITEPFTNIAIAKRVIDGLASAGPLSGVLEVNAFEKAPIKTGSIVSYGLSRAVKIDDGEPTFYSIWNSQNKERLATNDDSVLEEYIEFCTNSLKQYFLAFREMGIPKEMWTPDKTVSMVLTTLTINGLIHCAIRAIAEKKWRNKKSFELAFTHLRNSGFTFASNKFKYTSSHWGDLGEDIYSRSFAKI